MAAFLVVVVPFLEEGTGKGGSRASIKATKAASCRAEKVVGGVPIVTASDLTAMLCRCHYALSYKKRMDRVLPVLVRSQDL